MISRYFAKKSHPTDTNVSERPPIAISSPQIESLNSLEIPAYDLKASSSKSSVSDDSNASSKESTSITDHVKKLRKNTLIAENKNNDSDSEDDSGNSTSHEHPLADPRLIQRMHNAAEKHKISETHKVIQEAGTPFPQVFSLEGSAFTTNGFDGSFPLLEDHHYPTVKIRPSSLKLENSLTALTSYRDHFREKEHINLIARDDEHGPVVISVKNEDEDNDWKDIQNKFTDEILDEFIRKSENQTTKQYRVIIRTKQGIEDRRFTGYGNEPIKWFRMVHPEFRSVIQLKPVLSFTAWDDILKYDEHTLNNQYKFGIIHQTKGQTREKEFFSNTDVSPAFKEFLDLMGDTVKLKNFDKYAGGLDTKHDLTGEQSLYTSFEDKEIMFHVSTMLPHSDDEQQLARKRHIGNDICAIAFQDENTTFIPGSISSQFLHCYCIVQPIEPNTPNCRYKVSTACKNGVKEFPPELPKPDGVFKKGSEFRRFLLCKLINAETAAYRSKQFQKLNSRTRAELLENLYEELNTPSNFENELFNLTDVPDPPKPKNSKHLKKRVLESFHNLKKANKKEFKSKSSHVKVEKKLISQPVTRKFQSQHVKPSNVQNMNGIPVRKITFSDAPSRSSTAETSEKDINDLSVAKRMQISRLLKGSSSERLNRKRFLSTDEVSSSSSKNEMDDSFFEQSSPTFSDSTRHYSTGDLSNSSGSLDKLMFNRLPRKFAIRRRQSDQSDGKHTTSSGSKCSGCIDHNIPVSALEQELAMLRAEKEAWIQEKKELLGKLSQVRMTDLESYDDEILI